MLKLNTVEMNRVMLLNECDFINGGSIYCTFLNGQDHNFKHKTLFLYKSAFIQSLVKAWKMNGSGNRSNSASLEESGAFKWTTTDATKVVIFPLYFAVG